MSTIRCPYCGTNVPVIPQTTSCHEICYLDCNTCIPLSDIGKPSDFKKYGTNSSLQIIIYRCPECYKSFINAVGFGDFKNVPYHISPFSSAIKFPEYIPLPIRSDYEEACAIVNLSPKASATLSRRCLQGMIRDFWGIKKNRLIDEIDALQDKIPVTQWNAIHALRQLGNIGAHMEKDVNTIIDIEPDEAKQLLKLIELLLEKWYINRHDEENLLDSIIEINSLKKDHSHKP